MSDKHAEAKMGTTGQTWFPTDGWCRTGGFPAASFADCTSVEEQFGYLPVDNATGDPSGWTLTPVEAGLGGDSTVKIDDAVGGWLLFTTDNAIADGVNLQMKGEIWKLVTGKLLWFETSLYLTAQQIFNAELICGLCITQPALFGGMSDGVYFRKADATTNLEFVTEKNTVETSQVVLTATDAVTRLGFHFDGAGRVYPVVNGTVGIPHLLTIPDDEELTISYEFLTGAAAVNYLHVDWVRCIQLR